MAARAVVAPRVGVAILGLRHLGAVAAEEEEREGPDEEEEDDGERNAAPLGKRLLLFRWICTGAHFALGAGEIDTPTGVAIHVHRAGSEGEQHHKQFSEASGVD